MSILTKQHNLSILTKTTLVTCTVADLRRRRESITEEAMSFFFNSNTVYIDISSEMVRDVLNHCFSHLDCLNDLEEIAAGIDEDFLFEFLE